MRIQCTLEDFPDCWVEVSESWTRAEERQIVEGNADKWIALWQRKVIACNLRTVDGEFLTQPAAVTWDSIDQMDVRLTGFVGAVLGTATQELRSLGKVSRRVSFNGSAPGK